MTPFFKSNFNLEFRKRIHIRIKEFDFIKRVQRREVEKKREGGGSVSFGRWRHIGES